MDAVSIGCLGASFLSLALSPAIACFIAPLTIQDAFRQAERNGRARGIASLQELEHVSRAHFEAQVAAACQQPEASDPG